MVEQVYLQVHIMQVAVVEQLQLVAMLDPLEE
jgi:hypothetical protein